MIASRCTAVDGTTRYNVGNTVDGKTFTLHTSRADAILGQNKIDFAATGSIAGKALFIEATCGSSRADPWAPNQWDASTLTCESAPNTEETSESQSKMYAPWASTQEICRARHDVWEDSGSCREGDAGRYLVKYTTPRTGSYELHVSHATRGGLMGRYFNNRWLFGSHVEERVDATVNFEWPGHITETGKDFISVRWTGYVRPAFSESYTFQLQVNDGARLWVDGVQLLDAWEDDLGESTTAKWHNVSTSHALAAGRLYDILLEFRENKHHAVAKLYWQSASQPSAVIPAHHLFHTAAAIGSADADLAGWLSTADLTAAKTQVSRVRSPYRPRQSSPRRPRKRS